jgi:hypothetical protein
LSTRATAWQSRVGSACTGLAKTPNPLGCPGMRARSVRSVHYLCPCVSYVDAAGLSSWLVVRSILIQDGAILTNSFNFHISAYSLLKHRPCYHNSPQHARAPTLCLQLSSRDRLISCRRTAATQTQHTLSTHQPTACVAAEPLPAGGLGGGGYAALAGWARPQVAVRRLHSRRTTVRNTGRRTPE